MLVWVNNLFVPSCLVVRHAFPICSLLLNLLTDPLVIGILLQMIAQPSIVVNWPVIIYPIEVG